MGRCLAREDLEKGRNKGLTNQESGNVGGPCGFGGLSGVTCGLGVGGESLLALERWRWPPGAQKCPQRDVRLGFMSLCSGQFSAKGSEAEGPSQSPSAHEVKEVKLKANMGS